MVRFCPLCDNLLLPGIILVCTSCKTEFPIEPEDNIVGEYSKPEARNRYVTMLSGSIKDPAVAKIYQKCKKCKVQIAYALLGETEHAEFLCECPSGPTFDIDENLLLPPHLTSK